MYRETRKNKKNIYCVDTFPIIEKYYLQLVDQELIDKFKNDDDNSKLSIFPLDINFIIRNIDKKNSLNFNFEKLSIYQDLPEYFISINIKNGNLTSSYISNIICYNKIISESFREKLRKLCIAYDIFE